ncbi:hypothetical protein MsAg5_10670 [Methanosarcinaceae archaeon Ag5]|uniref:Imm-5-like domain-containing protein n=1 Tax=Methanolapillus africanus TaxID=3028297 RepID=A0AAE4SE27_9EURY|nr:hypothetical protein [Methanosarcinaceae archaeon Ag5]
MKKILFSRDSPCIQPIRSLVEKQNHRTLVLWALDTAPHVLTIFEEKYPDDKRPQDALSVVRAWSKGEIKMPEAKKAILAAHKAAAVAEDPAAQAAARAAGHAAATVHVETHALGVVFYGLTAFIYAADPKDADAVTEKECQWFYDRLLYWEKNADAVETAWAPFLLKEAPNKEKLLREKEEQKRLQKQLQSRK